MRKIKVRTRKNMPETNSSSSHVLAIYGGDYTTEGLSEFLSDDGKILTIPGDIEFGRNSETFNHIISKMQYACFGFDDLYKNNKPIFEEVVKNYLGVEEIRYDWINDTDFENWCEANPDKEPGDCPHLYSPIDGHRLDESPTIDHESVDTMIFQVYESKETLKDFIFGKNSWIFSGEMPDDPEDYIKSLGENDGYLILSIIPSKEKFLRSEEERIDIEVFPNFPYSEGIMDNNKWDDGLWSLSMWGGSNDKPKWLNINHSSIPEHSLTLLSSIWIKQEEGNYTLQIGTPPEDIKEGKILVPWVTPNVFKYPFRLNFFPISMFSGDSNPISKLIVDAEDDDKEGIEKVLLNGKHKIKYLDPSEVFSPEFSINLVPSLDKITIDEYI